MKITAKTTKEQLVQFLGANAKAIREKDEDLYGRIAYANKMLGKDESKVTKKDLVDLSKEAMKLLGEDVVESAKTEEASKPKAENSIKAKPTKKKTKEVPESVESEETEEVSEEKPAEESKPKKKSAKKSLGKKKEPKEGVIALEGTENSKSMPMAKMFPQTLKVSDKEYTLASDIQTMDDLYEAVIDKGEEIVIAHYWSKRHLKQFPYYGGWLGQPKQFDYDLDLSAIIHVSEDKIISYALSMYTEALYVILPKEIAEEDGMRFNNGIEYQIYRTV